MGTIRGSLTVVGTGISVGQITYEARRWIESAGKVLYCVADSATERLILRLNSNAESLYVFYGENKRRGETYKEMVDRILECVREGQKVCAVFYGHPGIFVHPSHEAIQIARSEGYTAKMLPAVSSLDCLFCDLGIDPAGGCQMVEATDLLLRRRAVDPYSHVIVWQIAATGDLAFSFKGYDCRNLPELVEYLIQFYPEDYDVVVYEAAQYPVCDPVIQHVKLKDIRQSVITGVSTLYVPPLEKQPVHMSVLKSLGLEWLVAGKTLTPAE
jgi:uncharacterized protein YabN with tetrapyrrole methylase and pyrophosphatase domain